MFIYKKWSLLLFTEQRMQRQRPKKRAAQMSLLFVATKMPSEWGNVKHSEQKVLVSLLPFKSQNTYWRQSCKDRYRRRPFSRTQRQFAGKDPSAAPQQLQENSWAATRAPGPPLPPSPSAWQVRASAAHAVSPGNASNPSCKLQPLSNLCTPISAESAMGTAAEG